MASRRAGTVNESRGTVFSARLLPLLVLALALQAAPTASARHWFWNHGLFPVVADPAPVAAIPPGSAAVAGSAGTVAAAAGDGSSETIPVTILSNETMPPSTRTVPPSPPHQLTAAPLAPVPTTPREPAAPAPAPAPLEAAPPAASPPAAVPSADLCYDVAPVDPRIVSGAKPDPCAALAAELKRTGLKKMGGKTDGMGFAAPSLFRACYATFLFRKDCDVEDLLSIANTFDNHYVYKHIAVDSPDQTNLPSSIDIVADLRKIVARAEAGKYVKLVDAHMAAYRATSALNDGHSSYTPDCFAGEFNLPLPLMAVVENGQQIIRVAPRRYITPKGMNTVAKVLHNFDFDLYEGRQVVAINGDKAKDYILKWADKEVGTFRNRAARFNKAFARNEVEKSLMGTDILQVPGDFARRGFAPGNDTLLVSFATNDGASTEDVQVPWIGAKKIDSFGNATDYWAKFCAAQKPSGAAAGGTSAQTTTVGRHADTPVYLVGGSTAVIWLHEYIPSNQEVMDELDASKVDVVDYMLHHITKALQTAAQSNASQIIIDVRDNMGGSTVAAFATIRLLMGAKKVPPSDFTLPMDFIVGTNYTENAIAVLSVDPTTLYLVKYTDLNGTPLTSAFGYAPFRTLNFSADGPAGTYTALFKSPDEPSSANLTAEQQQPVFGDRPFLVLSDGNCFSACAILTHVLGKRHKVPMVTVGGLPNQPPDVGSSCLGFTQMDMTPISTALSALARLYPEQASKPLKVKGVIGMALTNGYVDSEIPCEFEFLPSQHHIDYTVDLIDKPWAIWSEVAKLLATAAA
ncbi:hypothetical protein CLOM_g17216 [Closterium sp. NIES-68]|nr:hypothetical protein CLOM_g17216 [Closterium sp. NIES-68]GJP67263.1 hypothetical protein CLOP_g24103 [Closterium sp. NIES-67]